MNGSSPQKTGGRNTIRIGLTCVLSAIAVLIYFVIQLQADSVNRRNFQELETRARQILTVLAASDSEQGRYPASHEEFTQTLATFDPTLSAVLKQREILADFIPAKQGQTFTLSLKNKGQPGFAYICQGNQNCHWQPHLPYP